ncbi:MAG: DUF2853 family protein [Saprospiraceae bacterium]
MATYEETLAQFKKEVANLGIHIHEDLFHEITKSLGPSIHNNDASKVACSDPKELEGIRTNFLIGKLGLEDTPALDAAIQEVCGALGKSNRNKHRTTFYYLLTAKFKKEDVFIDHADYHPES